MLGEEEQEELYEDLGDAPITAADDANIPVDIWLKKETDKDDENETGWWELHANNYIPRKGCCSGDRTYHARSKDRKVLVQLVQKHWVPLYETAIRILKEMKPDKDGIFGLYYWTDQ